MRLIDADKFIVWIDPGHLRRPSELCYSEIDLANMINNQPTANLWIPCSSGKMPEHNQRVFTTHKLYQGRPFTSTAFYLKKKDKVLGVDWNGEGFYQYSDGDYILRDDVIAWMPAEPYQEAME